MDRVVVADSLRRRTALKGGIEDVVGVWVTTPFPVVRFRFKRGLLRRELTQVFCLRRLGIAQVTQISVGHYFWYLVNISPSASRGMSGIHSGGVDMILIIF